MNVNMNVPLKRFSSILHHYRNGILTVVRKEGSFRVRHYSSGGSEKSERKWGPVTWRTLGITALIGAGFGIYVRYLKESKEAKILRERHRALGRASIGGRFDLIDHKGRVRKSEDFLGQWLLLYFGFTHCPDICPDELEKIVAVVNKLGAMPDTPKVLPVFISVDPKRDTPEVVGKYVKEFSPKMIGLTGTPDQIEKVSKAYRVYYSLGPKDDTEDYIVDHTIITYLVNPDGEFVDYYGQSKNADEVVDSILINMAKYGYSSKKTSGWW